MTSATDRLRALLDERGVEWEDASPVPSMRPWKTSYTSFTGEEVTISDYDEPKWLMGTLVFFSPEQAIDATLGRGTCHRALDFDGTRYVCSACGEHFGPCRWHYCPNCGAKVVE